MGGVPAKISEKLLGRAPIEQVLHAYEDKDRFFQELNNYLVGGLVISCSKFLVGGGSRLLVRSLGGWKRSPQDDVRFLDSVAEGNVPPTEGGGRE